MQSAFTTTGSEEIQVKCSSTTKIKVKALDVMLGLFRELEHSSTEEITIEALDFKVASAYIIPIIKKQMDSSKNDKIIKLAIA